MMPDSPFWALYLTLLAFAFGACVGSFLNVCIHRIPYGESVIHPRSHCPHCGYMIPFFLNVPLVSWVMLRGRCRNCRAPISPRYFLVELLTAVLFLVVWNQHGIAWVTLVYWLIIAGLILGTFVDFEHMILPDRVTIGGMILGVLFSALLPELQMRETWADSLKASVIGLAAGAGSLYLVGLLGKLAFKKDAMGLGDVKLLGAVGAFFGWQAVYFTIMLSALAGTLVGVALILRRKKEWQSRIPYGPYIALAALIWMLGGSTWWQRYVQWLMEGV